jgi:hypothetical protein
MIESLNLDGHMHELLAKEDSTELFKDYSPLKMIADNLRETRTPERVRKTGYDPRNIMAIVDSPLVWRILFDAGVCDVADTEVIFGSRFVNDRDSTLYLYRTIERTQSAMAKGRTCVLLKLGAIYDCFYDMLNQRYITIDDMRFCMICVGGDSIRCRIDDNFRCIVVVARDEAHHSRSVDADKHTPVAFLNRFEKVNIDPAVLLTVWNASISRVKTTIQRKLNASLICRMNNDLFVGYHSYSWVSLVISTMRLNGALADDEKKADEEFDGLMVRARSSASMSSVQRRRRSSFDRVSELLSSEDAILPEVINDCFGRLLQNMSLQFFMDDPRNVLHDAFLPYADLLDVVLREGALARETVDDLALAGIAAPATATATAHSLIKCITHDHSFAGSVASFAGVFAALRDIPGVKTRQLVKVNDFASEETPEIDLDRLSRGNVAFVTFREVRSFQSEVAFLEFVQEFFDARNRRANTLVLFVDPIDCDDDLTHVMHLQYLCEKAKETITAEEERNERVRSSALMQEDGDAVDRDLLDVEDPLRVPKTLVIVQYMNRFLGTEDPARSLIFASDWKLLFCDALLPADNARRSEVRIADLNLRDLRFRETLSNRVAECTKQIIADSCELAFAKLEFQDNLEFDVYEQIKKIKSLLGIEHRRNIFEEDVADGQLAGDDALEDKPKFDDGGALLRTLSVRIAAVLNDYEHGAESCLRSVLKIAKNRPPTAEELRVIARTGKKAAEVMPSRGSLRSEITRNFAAMIERMLLETLAVIFQDNNCLLYPASGCVAGLSEADARELDFVACALIAERKIVQECTVDRDGGFSPTVTLPRGASFPFSSYIYKYMQSLKQSVVQVSWKREVELPLAHSVEEGQVELAKQLTKTLSLQGFGVKFDNLGDVLMERLINDITALEGLNSWSMSFEDRRYFAVIQLLATLLKNVCRKTRKDSLVALQQVAVEEAPDETVDDEKKYEDEAPAEGDVLAFAAGAFDYYEDDDFGADADESAEDRKEAEAVKEIDERPAPEEQVPDAEKAVEEIPMRECGQVADLFAALWSYKDIIDRICQVLLSVSNANVIIEEKLMGIVEGDVRHSHQWLSKMLRVIIESVNKDLRKSDDAIEVFTKKVEGVLRMATPMEWLFDWLSKRYVEEVVELKAHWSVIRLFGYCASCLDNRFGVGANDFFQYLWTNFSETKGFVSWERIQGLVSMVRERKPDTLSILVFNERVETMLQLFFRGFTFDPVRIGNMDDAEKGSLRELVGNLFDVLQFDGADDWNVSLATRFEITSSLLRTKADFAESVPDFFGEYSVKLESLDLDSKFCVLLERCEEQRLHAAFAVDAVSGTAVGNAPDANAFADCARRLYGAENTVNRLLALAEAKVLIFNSVAFMYNLLSRPVFSFDNVIGVVHRKKPGVAFKRDGAEFNLEYTLKVRSLFKNVPPACSDEVDDGGEKKEDAHSTINVKMENGLRYYLLLEMFSSQGSRAVDALSTRFCSDFLGFNIRETAVDHGLVVDGGGPAEKHIVPFILTDTPMNLLTKPAFPDMDAEDRRLFEIQEKFSAYFTNPDAGLLLDDYKADEFVHVGTAIYQSGYNAEQQPRTIDAALGIVGTLFNELVCIPPVLDERSHFQTDKPFEWKDEDSKNFKHSLFHFVQKLSKNEFGFDKFRFKRRDRAGAATALSNQLLRMGVHLSSTILSLPTSPLSLLLCGPGKGFANLPLLGMPEDQTKMLMAAMVNYGVWLCPNDHIYFVGNCTWTNEASTCQECGAPIGNLVGGGSHTPAPGNRRIGKIGADGEIVFEEVDPYTKKPIETAKFDTKGKAPRGFYLIPGGDTACREFDEVSIRIARLLISLVLLMSSACFDCAKNDLENQVRDLTKTLGDAEATRKALFDQCVRYLSDIQERLGMRSSESACNILHAIIHMFYIRFPESYAFGYTDFTIDGRATFEAFLLEKCIRPVLDDLDACAGKVAQVAASGPLTAFWAKRCTEGFTLGSDDLRVFVENFSPSLFLPFQQTTLYQFTQRFVAAKATLGDVFAQKYAVVDGIFSTLSGNNGNGYSMFALRDVPSMLRWIRLLIAHFNRRLKSTDLTAMNGARPLYSAAWALQQCEENRLGNPEVWLASLSGFVEAWNNVARRITTDESEEGKRMGGVVEQLDGPRAGEKESEAKPVVEDVDAGAAAVVAEPAELALEEAEDVKQEDAEQDDCDVQIVGRDVARAFGAEDFKRLVAIQNVCERIAVPPIERTDADWVAMLLAIDDGVGGKLDSSTMIRGLVEHFVSVQNRILVQCFGVEDDEEAIAMSGLPTMKLSSVTSKRDIVDVNLGFLVDSVQSMSTQRLEYRCQPAAADGDDEKKYEETDLGDAGGISFNFALINHLLFERFIAHRPILKIDAKSFQFECSDSVQTEAIIGEIARKDPGFFGHPPQHSIDQMQVYCREEVIKAGAYEDDATDKRRKAALMDMYRSVKRNVELVLMHIRRAKFGAGFGGIKLEKYMHDMLRLPRKDCEAFEGKDLFLRHLCGLWRAMTRFIEFESGEYLRGPTEVMDMYRVTVPPRREELLRQIVNKTPSAIIWDVLSMMKAFLKNACTQEPWMPAGTTTLSAYLLFQEPGDEIKEVIEALNPVDEVPDQLMLCHAFKCYEKLAEFYHDAQN